MLVTFLVVQSLSRFFHKRVDTLRLLLERSANPNRVFASGNLLCEAVTYGAEIIRLLLAKGANPDIRCNDGPGSLYNCLHDCTLSKAASNGKLDVLEVLINYGADVNPKNLQYAYGSPLTAAIAWESSTVLISS
jgi:ankyrin repeat protein